MVNAYAKPEPFNKILAGKVGLRLEMLHVKSLKLKIPWFNWSAGVDIELDSLLVVVRPLASDHWSLDEVRTRKEQEPTLTLALFLAPSTHPDPDPHSDPSPGSGPDPNPNPNPEP